MRYITLDIEGDGLSQEYNKQVFPEGNHYDKDTRIWCVTFHNGSTNKTFVCKLPKTTRRLPRPYRVGNSICWYTRAFHEDSTVVPETLNGYRIERIDDYGRFLKRIAEFIETASKLGIIIYFKGYGSYNYDKDALRDNFAKFGINCDLSCLINKSVNNWHKTTPQVNSRQHLANQQYMEQGIIHNIEDAKQLFDYCTKETTCQDLQDGES